MLPCRPLLIQTTKIQKNNRLLALVGQKVSSRSCSIQRQWNPTSDGDLVSNGDLTSEGDLTLGSDYLLDHQIRMNPAASTVVGRFTSLLLCCFMLAQSDQQSQARLALHWRSSPGQCRQ
jgi:hypothetical protein